MTNGEPTVHTVLKLAQEAMAKHGLVGWAFKFNTNKRRLGVCKKNSLLFRNRLTGERRIEHRPGGSIELSIHVLKLGWKEIQDTILHEIAHALAPDDVKHGHEWQMIAIRVGAVPRACAKLAAPLVEGRWIARCPRCGYQHRCHKRPRRAKKACGKCCRTHNRGQYHPDYQLEYIDTHENQDTHRQLNRAIRRRVRGARFKVR